MPAPTQLSAAHCELEAKCAHKHKLSCFVMVCCWFDTFCHRAPPPLWPRDIGTFTTFVCSRIMSLSLFVVVVGSLLLVCDKRLRSSRCLLAWAHEHRKATRDRDLGVPAITARLGLRQAICS